MIYRNLDSLDYQTFKFIIEYMDNALESFTRYLQEKNQFNPSLPDETIQTISISCANRIYSEILRIIHGVKESILIQSISESFYDDLCKIEMENRISNKIK